MKVLKWRRGMEAAYRVFEHAMILLGTPVTSHMVSIRLSRCSKPVAWHKDEENNNGHADEDGDEQDHHGALVQEVPDVWFADA